MKVRYSPKFLVDLEDIFKQAGYPVRYAVSYTHLTLPTNREV